MRSTVRSLQSRQFEQAVEPWLDDLRRLATRLTGNAADADDLVQDLLVRLHSRMAEVAALDQPRPWLARVLYRMFVDQWRRRRAGPERDEDAVPDEQATTADLPDETFERGLTAERLHNALEQLPDFQRDLVLLHDVEGYTLAEIGEITDTPTGTLKSRLHRARSALRMSLAGI